MDFIKGLMVEIGVDLKEFRAGLASAKKDLQNFGEQAKSISGEFSKVSAVFAAAGGWAIKLAGDLEATSLSFRVLTKDAAAAAVIQKQLNDYADKSPFEGDDVTLGGKRLIAYKFALKDVIPYLKDAGDLAATFADQGVKVADVATVFGRLKSGNFGEAFERLRDFGIDRSQLEGEGLKFDKSGAYKGSVEAALNAVRKIIQKNYGGMADALGSTLPGMLATAWDGVKRFAQDIGNALVQTFDIKGLLGDFSSFLSGLKEGFNSLSPMVQKIILGFGTLVVVLPPLLGIVGSIITAMPLLAAGFAALTGPIGIAVAAFAAATAAIIYHWDSIKKALQDTGVWTFLKNIVKSSLGVIISVFGVFANAFTGDWANMWDHVKNIVKYAWNGIVSMIQGAMTIVTKAFTGLLGLVAPTNAGKLQAFFDKSIAIYDGVKANVPDMTKKLQELKTNFDALGSGGTVFKKIGEDTEKASSSLDNYKKKLQDLVDWVKSFRATGLGVLSDMAVGPIGSKDVKQQVSGVSNGQVQWTTGQSDAMKEYLKGFEMPTGEDMLKAVNEKAIREKMQATAAIIKEEADKMSETLNSTLTNAAADAFTGMASVVGAMFAGAASMADFGSYVGQMIGGLFEQIGKAYIQFGASKMLADALAVTPFGGVAMLGIGAGIVALGSMLKNAASNANKAPKFAEGWGGASGATMAWFGDNHDARTNQEFILRKDQVKSILNRAADNAGMGKGAVLVHEIEGSKLKLILTRAEDKLSLG